MVQRWEPSSPGTLVFPSPKKSNQHFQIAFRPGIRELINRFVDVLPLNNYLFICNVIWLTWSFTHSQGRLFLCTVIVFSLQYWLCPDMMCNHNILRSFLGHGPLTGCFAHVPKRNEKKKNERKKKLEKQIWVQKGPRPCIYCTKLISTTEIS